GSYDYEAILKNGNSNKLRCYEIENEYCNLVCYVDLETLSCVRVDGNLKKDSVIEIVIVDAPDGYVNLRYGSSTEYDIITEIQNGVQLDVYRMDDTGKWCGIWYKDNWGWIARSQVSTHEEVVMEYATNKVFTEAEIQEIKDRLEVPKELETTFAKGNVYYKESFGCAMIDVEIYHNGERIASAQIMDDGTEDGVGEFYRYSLYGKGSPFIP
ncbi:MAG: hypothetical protein IKJ01_08420, partial [Lachnospiraceae bacterium]|nr:hypothetical protein [Lachnospiraceae bacterium]